MLARIEPTADPTHDQRTFECKACGHEDVVTIKFV
jgi:transcription elongation factor Elf1